MGTCTFAVDPDGYTPLDSSNGGTMVRGVITMSNSYATGGDTLNASAVGLGVITKIDLGSGVPTAHTTGYLFGSLGTPSASPTIQAFWTGAALSGPFAEVTAATNLSTVTVSAIIYGT